ncbi:unnamed protein product [Polarella glacialis]|uniref:Major facilitator superfamily (MFS) profile domain-containing protein n=1 Tax=Polarella glacialis TaxID=89957 RepID=A0A813FUP3_POLGL|nr:unnamed protein product [Polarella glacialis]CAE8674952.1 unnamed protein product [Polarella glacialis]
MGGKEDDVEDGELLNAPLLAGRQKALPLAPLYTSMLLRTIALAVAMLPSFSLSVAAFAAAEGRDSASAASAAGLIVALRHMAEFVSAPLLAVWSDQAGRRRVLIACCLAFVLECVLMSVAPSLLVLGAAHVAGGFVCSGNAVESSCIADATPPGPARAVATGRLFTVIGLALVIGPMLGGALGVHYGNAAPFACAALLGLVALVVTVATLPEYLPESKRAHKGGTTAGGMSRASMVAPVLSLLKESPPLFWYAGAMALCSLGQSLFGTTNALWMKEAFGWDSQDLGRFLAVVGFSVIASQVIVLPFVLRAAKGRESLALKSCLLTNAVKFAAYAMAPNGFWLYMALFLTIPCFCTIPVLTSLCTRHVPASRQGLWSGSISALCTAANIIGALVGSRLFAASLRGLLPLGANLFVAAGCYLAAAAFVSRAELSRLPRKSQSGTEFDKSAGA